MNAGNVRVFAEYDADFHEETDVVVVGSGPGGAVVAKELACAGHDVLLLEEGPPYTPDDFVQDGGYSMARVMREGGLRTTRGTMLATMQANALGGGSLVNSAISVRAPDFTLDQWCAEFELSRTTRKDLDPHYDAVEKFLGIGPTPPNVMGRRNTLFRDACKTLGYSSEPMPRNVRGCRGSGECFTGCRARAKQSMDISYVPEAVRAGARVLTSVQVQRILTDGARAIGLTGQVVQPFTGKTSHRFEIRTKKIVLAAGVLATPLILKHSDNAANDSGHVGRNLQFHPGVGIMGIFPERTDPQFGATQGYQSLEFLREGFKLETLWAAPNVIAVRMPGFGHALKERLAETPYSAIWDGFVSTKQSFGRVRARRGSMTPKLTWKFHPDDLQVLGRVSWILTEMFFAAGARKVLPGIGRVPDELFSLEEAETLRDREYRHSDFVLAGTHVFGSTRMHGNPQHGVVDEFGRCHDWENLFITDTGVIPSSPSVNPMLTCMALAHRSAQQIASEL